MTAVNETSKIAEVVVASTTAFIAQCYELYEVPSLGSLVKTRSGDVELYAVVCNATTTGIEPGRKPIARGKDEASEEAIYSSNPQLTKLLRTEFSALMVGHGRDGKIFHYLPPGPARLHGFVYLCSPPEVKQFSQSLGFLNILINARLDVSPEELVAATLRQMGQSYGEGQRAFLVAAGKELAVLLSGEYIRLKAILDRLTGEDFTRSTSSGWTVIALLAHMAFWDQRILVLLRRWKEKGIDESPVDSDAINDALKPILLALQPSAAVELCLSSAEAADAELEAMTPRLFEQIKASGTHFRFNRALHRNDHLDEIEQLLRPPRR